MERTWMFRNKRYTMVKLHMYGHYTLNGYLTTDSTIWDYATDDENSKNMSSARIAAERFLRSKR